VQSVVVVYASRVRNCREAIADFIQHLELGHRLGCKSVGTFIGGMAGVSIEDRARKDFIPAGNLAATSGDKARHFHTRRVPKAENGESGVRLFNQKSGRQVPLTLQFLVHFE
jgi:hypothetical protein